MMTKAPTRFTILLRSAAATALLTTSASLMAGPFTIEITDYGNIDGIPALTSEIDSLVSSLETEINDELPDADESSYLRGMADSTAFATKGLGVDNASNPDLFVIGAGVGIGADVGNNSFSDLTGGKVDANELRGVGLQTTAMAGLNLGFFPVPQLGFIDLAKMRVFVNALSMDLPKFEDNFSGKLSSFGFHIQYQLLDEWKIPFWIRWGGVYFTTGMDMASMKFRFTETFNESVRETISYLSTSTTLVANYRGTATVDADVDVTTIPLELSTHLQLIHILTLFGGVGLDYTTGKANAHAYVDAPVTVNSTNNLIRDITGKAELNLGEEGKPASTSARWFLGTQVNITLLKIFAQLNHSIGKDLWGVTAGVRIAY